MGPMVGIVGALMAELALRALCGRPAHGEIWSLDAKREVLRKFAVTPRAGCPLCGAAPSILDTEESHYLPRMSAVREGGPWSEAASAN
jgi:hypothetical protein